MKSRIGSQSSLLPLSLAAFSIANAHDANRDSFEDNNAPVGPIVGSVESTTAHLLYRPDAKPTRLQLSQDGKLVSKTNSNCEIENDLVAKFRGNRSQPGAMISKIAMDLIRGFRAQC